MIHLTVRKTITIGVWRITVGMFRILGGGQGLEYWGVQGGKIPSKPMTSK